MEIFLLSLLTCLLLLILIAWIGMIITNEDKIITKTFIGLIISFVLGAGFGLFVTAMMIY